MLAITLILLAVSSVAFADQNSKKMTKVRIPKKPEIWEIHKNLDKEKFKPNLTVEPSDEELEIQNQDTVTRSLEGYYGPNYATQVEGSDIVVLNNSINISNEGLWSAKGLIRNETLEDAGKVSVYAELISFDGHLLDKISAEVLIERVRPGEPAPFIINSKVAASEVAEVKWSAIGKSTSNNISRNANIMVNYELAFGSESYKSIKREDAPYPYLMATSFDNLGESIKSAQIIAVWLDESGKVVWIEMRDLDPAFKDGVPIDGSAIFENIIVSDPIIAPKLSTYAYSLWVVGK